MIDDIALTFSADSASGSCLGLVGAAGAVGAVGAVEAVGAVGAGFPFLDLASSSGFPST